jgi:hypothetical protein
VEKAYEQVQAHKKHRQMSDLSAAQHHAGAPIPRMPPLFAFVVIAAFSELPPDM